MQEQITMQEYLSDLGLWSGKTCPVLSQATTEKISASCSKKLPELPTRPPIFLDLRGGIGAPLVLLWEEDFLSRGDYTTRNFGECPNEENVSLLSQILEAKPSEKYFLSAKACRGILDRANRKGKSLPIKLEEALIKQAGLSHSLSEPGKTGGVKEYLFSENEPLHSQPSTIKASCNTEDATAFVAGGHYRYKEDNKVGTLTTETSVRGDTTLIYGKSDFGTYKEDTATIRASGGDYGGFGNADNSERRGK